MESKIISGTELANKIKANLKEKIDEIKNECNKIPCLAVIIVGDDPASKIYVKNKEKACEKCGIKSLKYELPQETPEEELIKIIEKLNNNDEVNGILVQLPLPKHINTTKIIEKINPYKDVDCFHPINIGKLFVGDFDMEKSLLPCTPKGCVKLIKSINEDLTGKNVCVIGRSNIVGKPVAQLLLDENCTVKIAHSKTKDLKEQCLWADILIVATGKLKMITADMVKDGAIIIDVGINRTEEGLCGDVDFANVINKAKYITPVPGGVGPMTVACLMENVYNAFLTQNSILK